MNTKNNDTQLFVTHFLKYRFLNEDHNGQTGEHVNNQLPDNSSQKPKNGSNAHLSPDGPS